jgi:SAM-dependent methyltransferase
MNILSKEYLISFYDRNLLIHGDRPEALRWTADGQRKQYGLLLGMAGDIEGKKVLDYGCGKGDFYGFLRERGIDVNYTGLDINPSLIELARKKYSVCGRAAFGVFDVEDEALSEDFDFIFLCGVFNTNVEGVADTFKRVSERLFRHARRGLALTAVSSHVRERDFELNYTSPEEMLRFALGLTPRVSLSREKDFFAMCLMNDDGRKT